MPSITIKGISDELMEQLRARAEAQRRSLNREIIALLEAAVRDPGPAPAGTAEWAAFARQVDTLRERLHERYGVMPDSAGLIGDARNER